MEGDRRKEQEREKGLIFYLGIVKVQFLGIIEHNFRHNEDKF